MRNFAELQLRHIAQFPSPFDLDIMFPLAARRGVEGGWMIKRDTVSWEVFSLMFVLRFSRHCNVPQNDRIQAQV
jgi:hypothetical protein